jgi:hypothetical protein
LEYVDSQWFIACYQDVDTKIELVAVDKKWVGDIPRDHRGIIDIDIVDVVNNVDTFTLAGVRRLDDPNILL